MKQVSERLGPRLAEICRAYDRLEDWEDCRPSKDASRPGTWDHNHSPFSTGTTLKRQGRGCPVLLVRPRAAWSDTGIEALSFFVEVGQAGKRVIADRTGNLPFPHHLIPTCERARP